MATAANYPAALLLALLGWLRVRRSRESVGDDRYGSLIEAAIVAFAGFLVLVIKCQFIAAVDNYDPTLLEPDGVFFLASSQNHDFIEYDRAVLSEPAAFYDVLDRRATVVHEGGGTHERLLLYVTRSNVGARKAD